MQWRISGTDGPSIEYVTTYIKSKSKNKTQITSWPGKRHNKNRLAINCANNMVTLNIDYLKYEDSGKYLMVIVLNSFEIIKDAVTVLVHGMFVTDKLFEIFLRSNHTNKNKVLTIQGRLLFLSSQVLITLHQNKKALSPFYHEKYF